MIIARDCDPLRRFAWSRFKNWGLFTISAVRARPSAEIRVVELQKLRTFAVRARPSAEIRVVEVQKLRTFYDLAAARAVRALCERDPRATVVSIDGVGAYDHVHRASMLGGLAGDNTLAPLLPFARLFYAESSTYLWYDDAGMPRSVVQAEGGEQGDPLMPALALQAASATLLPRETMFAYLDDVYAVCQPKRVRAVAGVARVVLQEHAGIEVHLDADLERGWRRTGRHQCASRAGAWTLPPERAAWLLWAPPTAFHFHMLARSRKNEKMQASRILDARFATAIT